MTFNPELIKASDSEIKKTADAISRLHGEASAIQQAYEDAAFLLAKAADEAEEASALLFKAQHTNNRKGYDHERTEGACAKAYDLIIGEAEQLEQIAFARLREAVQSRDAFDSEHYDAFLAIPGEEDEDPED